jgi:N-acetylglucosaminyldiphosphoundecaprenol N-acetyl-beta-D-mannosaminyltransferase
MAVGVARIGAASVRPYSGRTRSRTASSGRVDGDRIPISGVLIDRVGLAEATTRIAAFLSSERLHQIVTVNLDFLQIARADATFRRTIDEADLAVADGMPLVWASRLMGRPLPERVTGNQLVHECCRLSAAMRAGIFLLGARPGIAEAAAQKIAASYPGAVVAGAFSPSFGPRSPNADREVVERVNRSGARILFVALGAPRQDNWIAAHRHELDVRVAIGVGCSLDVLAGSVPRAPLWMQRSGLEWLYRLRLEPRRLWHRYLVKDTRMFASLFADSLRAALVSR